MSCKTSPVFHSEIFPVVSLISLSGQPGWASQVCSFFCSLSSDMTAHNKNTEKVFITELLDQQLGDLSLEAQGFFMAIIQLGCINLSTALICTDLQWSAGNCRQLPTTAPKFMTFSWRLDDVGDLNSRKVDIFWGYCVTVIHIFRNIKKFVDKAVKIRLVSVSSYRIVCFFK